jgi:translation initiation factor 6
MKRVTMAVTKAANFGNPHIGLFAKASEKFVFADTTSSPKFIAALSVFDVPVITTSFGGSGLAGLYIAMNSNGAVIPSFSAKDEVAKIKAHGLNVLSLPGKFSAAANNIAANDFGAIANPEMPNELLRKISDCLGVETVKKRIAGYTTMGSAIFATNKGFAAHNRATEEELKDIQSVLKVAGTNCTLNTGVAFVSIGMVANSRAAVVGEATTGFEMGRIAEALSLF